MPALPRWERPRKPLSKREGYLKNSKEIETNKLDEVRFDLEDVDLEKGRELIVKAGRHHVVIEDNEAGPPEFRVMVGAEEDGLHVMVWPQGWDLNQNPHQDILILGWCRGKDIDPSRPSSRSPYWR